MSGKQRKRKSDNKERKKENGVKPERCAMDCFTQKSMQNNYFDSEKAVGS